MVEKNKASSLEKNFKIKIPYSEVEKKIEENYIELSKTLKIPGFRPGKVPLSFVKNKYEKEIKSKVTEKIIQEEGNKGFESSGFRLAAQPKVKLISNIDDQSDLEAEFEFEVLPNIKLMEFKNLKLSKYVSQVAEKDIDKVIDNLFNDYKDYNEPIKKRKSKEGDRLIISYKGLLGGDPFEGGSAEKQTIDLGKNNYFPEFEKNLLGKNKEDSIEFDMTFPKDYNNEKLNGKKVKFKVNIDNILEGKRLNSEDELAKKTGSSGSKDLRVKIKSELEKYSEDLSFNMLKRSIVDSLKKEHSFPLPNILVEREVEAIKANSKVESKSKDLDKKYLNDAKDKVKVGLIVSEIGIKNKINVSEKELETALAKICMQYPGKEKEVVEHYKSNPAYMNSIRGPIFENKVMKFISDNAIIIDEEISSDDLLKKISEIEKQDKNLNEKKVKDAK